MYKKVLEFQDSINQLKDAIIALNNEIETTTDALSLIMWFQKKISDLQMFTNSFPKQLRQEMLTDLKHFSDALKGMKYKIFEQHLNQYVSRIQVTMIFMINYPHLFIENPDEQMSSILDMHDLCRELLWDMYMDAQNPQYYLDLCKNVPLLDSQKKDIFLKLSQKIFSTLLKDVLDEIADRDDERKKDLVNWIKQKYPKASNSTLHHLLSKNKWNALKQDFLVYVKKWLDDMIQSESSKIFSHDFHETMRSLSIFFVFLTNDDELDAMFTTYVSLFVKDALNKSHQSKISQSSHKNNSFISTFMPKFDPSKNVIAPLKPLPDLLKSDIKAYLSSKKINGWCDKLIAIVEKILQKLFTRNEAVRRQRFINKIFSYGYHDCIQDDFFDLLEKYDFHCIDDTKSIQEVSEIVADEQNLNVTIHKEQPIQKNDILIALEWLDALDRWENESRRDYIFRKVSWLSEIFEQIWYSFEDKEKFIASTTDYCLSNDRLYNELKKLIYDIIVKGKKEQYKDGKKYYTFNILIK